MNFTFGIITGGGNEGNINKIIDSIEKQQIQNYEILIIGNSNIKREKTIVISFNETIKRAWITKKKNIITENAKYENIVYLHDYIYLLDDWYKEFLNYGEDFKLCMNQILNNDGTRFRDWTLWAHDSEKIINSKGFLIPYDMTHLSKIMYFSGSYWVAKKSVMEEFPLNENLLWGQGEDVLWSKQVRQKYDFSINEKSKVRLMKQKDKAFNYSSEKDIEILKKINL